MDAYPHARAAAKRVGQRARAAAERIRNAAPERECPCPVGACADHECDPFERDEAQRGTVHTHLDPSGHHQNVARCTADEHCRVTVEHDCG